VSHADLAQLAAVLGALGSILVLLARGRETLLAGFVLLAAGEAGLGVALVPGHDLRRLVAGPLHVAALAVAVAVVGALAWGLFRRPELVPFALLVAAPFRLPVGLGDQEAFLLLPLYGVLAAAVLALALRSVRGEPVVQIPTVLAVPAAAFLSLSGLSLLWSQDMRQGSIELVFFLFPFAALVAVVARSPLPEWATRGLAIGIVALASLFALVGLWQAWRREVFFARDVEAINAYTTFFRVTSLFKDPSLYGRHLVLGLAVVLLALWLRKLNVVPATGLVALLFAGLFFAYSQSSLVALFAVTLALTLVAADKRSRIVVLVAAAALALVAAAASAAIVQGQSVRKATSGRSRLVKVTLVVIRKNPLHGVGIGAQPLASRKEAETRTGVRRNASHTTPLTVAAELGLLGVLAYLALLAGAAAMLLAVVRRNRELGLGLAAVFLVLVAHSVFYSGFFEDPLMWGALALSAAALQPVGATQPDRGYELLDSLSARIPRIAVTRRTAAFVLAGLALVLLGLFAAARLRDRPSSGLDTELKGVQVVGPKQGQSVPVAVKPKRKGGSYRFLPDDRLCWPTFGRNDGRTLALPLRLGLPTKHFWVRGLRSYIEFPPVYCDGVLYLNTYKGTTFAIDALSGTVLWRRPSPGLKPSSPAIAGPRLLVASRAGTVTAYARANGALLWQFRVSSKVESSPLVVGNLAYVGAHDGRLFALDVRTGRVRWAYDTGGRINSSASVAGDRVFITTYSGAIFCLRRTDGKKLWRTYVKRDFLRYESFYASASTDGRRLFTVARSGRVVALSAATGKILWKRRVGGGLAYSTPAVSEGRIFVGGFDGTLYAFSASSGKPLWRRHVGGRILGPALVVGSLVFFSTLEERTFAARTGDGRLVWRLRMGKYAPGIATDRHYFFSLNGILIAYRAESPVEYRSKKTR
jgi:outer membrane protein assembly factor BamB